MLSRLCCCLSRGAVPENGSKVNSSSADAAATHAKSLNSAATHTQNGANEGRKGKGSGPSEGKGPNQSAVLVELFTSQGCSSCPSADLLISKLGQGKSQDLALDVPVLVLAYHVDYWDYLGWKDTFASSFWTVRQRAYGQALQQDSIYTPEVVVQGRKHCVASNLDSILSLVHEAPRFPANFSRQSSSALEVSLAISLKFKVEGFTLDVMVSIYENGLVTNCAKGENVGRVLTNDFVVRGLEKAVTIQDWPAKKSIKGKVTLSLWEGYTKSRCGLTVFLQNPQTLEVYGALPLELPEEV
ncbi:hypothetical protein O6H91_18G031400 [Diphasiastrum complanatum]|uniref:Uncharacterized protein n=1 Tax=Diphasiastrum complanatum TaxID=34168 RepID=A0ACC2AZI3_DIPCM|nr:hypothetical protein O6H91_18G031400 [Diphasiastrum complanatum]